MSRDISRILKGWSFQRDAIKVRKIRGLDGKPKLQMRVDMGLIQMEVRGRPDGKRPYGRESFLDYYLERLRRYVQKYGVDDGFHLQPRECMNLRDEALQYYYRYLSLFHLGDYEGVIRDTEKNLQLFDFMRKYALETEDQYSLEKYRPYLIMMNTRARALLCLREENLKAALEVVEEGIKEITGFFAQYSPAEIVEESSELNLLQELAEEIRRRIPPSPLTVLRKELEKAVVREEFEKAAALRDKIRELESRRRKG